LGELNVGSGRPPGDAERMRRIAWQIFERRRSGEPNASRRRNLSKASTRSHNMATTGATSREHDARSNGVGRIARRLTTETKQAFKTSEFWAMVGLIVAILISAAVINGGDNGTDQFIARQAWLYVSILGAGYFISRGLAKSGSSDPYTDERDEAGKR
jgi:hypothetical protein